MATVSQTSMLHVGTPNVGDRQIFDQIVDQIFERRWFTNDGSFLQQLEQELANYLQVEHCVLVCNATVGMQIACHALGLTGEVLLPSFTFVATAHALQWERLTPVFCEVDPLTHNIDVNSLESRITDRTTGIVGVHVWGEPCATRQIESIATKYDLKVMYDAAHAFGCKHQGQMIGNFGDCEVFSFHATKFFNTFEGGAITTNDHALAEKARLMRNFGFKKMDTVIHLGTNGKMSEIHAAMGLANLKCLDQFIEQNRQNHQHYQARLHGAPGIRLLTYDHLEATNWQYVVVEIDESEFGESRDDVFDRLMALGIRARRYFFPGCHRMEPYASLYPRQRERLPVTDELCGRVLLLPNGTSISNEDIDRVCDVILP